MKHRFFFCFWPLTHNSLFSCGLKCFSLAHVTGFNTGATECSIMACDIWEIRVNDLMIYLSLKLDKALWALSPLGFPIAMAVSFELS